MACKWQIRYNYNNKYYYFIVILTYEAFLPAVHKSNMKQRKFVPMLIALINSSLPLTRVLWRSSLSAVLCCIIGMKPEMRLSCYCCRRRRRRRCCCCCFCCDCRLLQSTFTVALTLLTCLGSTRLVSWSGHRLFWYPPQYLKLGHHSFLHLPLQSPVWCHRTTVVKRQLNLIHED